MPAATLSDVLQPALRDGYAVAGLVVLGWEDVVAFVRAAEALDAPVILQAGPGCRKHTPIAVLGTMFRTLADQASVPVVCHVDHGFTLDECVAGIEYGFTSVMYDGSKRPLAENIETTARIVEIARAAGVSVEGEVGVVGYSGGGQSYGTEADEAARFDAETGVDALAISVGNVHLVEDSSSVIDWDRLRAIEAVTRSPLVLHGGSGLTAGTRAELARTSRVCKFNIGTELRMTFGAALRETLADHPELFDRIAILDRTMAPMEATARQVIANLLPAHWPVENPAGGAPGG
ncbi:class II fructose-bisphosphate aldolase [Bauldia sp.]|uniref:class II fructose-bisphosphate aldolase n=1 Tax=Bauldia sp. TaxID=2575872 RepID=UPI003BACF1B3